MLQSSCSSSFFLVPVRARLQFPFLCPFSPQLSHLTSLLTLRVLSRDEGIIFFFSVYQLLSFDNWWIRLEIQDLGALAPVGDVWPSKFICLSQSLHRIGHVCGRTTLRYTSFSVLNTSTSITNAPSGSIPI